MKKFIGLLLVGLLLSVSAYGAEDATYEDAIGLNVHIRFNVRHVITVEDPGNPAGETYKKWVYTPIYVKATNSTIGGSNLITKGIILEKYIGTDSDDPVAFSDTFPTLPSFVQNLIRDLITEGAVLNTGE